MFQTDSTFYKDSINSAIVPENSIIQSVYDLNSTVSTVAHNTTPYDFGLGDLVWWNFGIAILALVASLIAAYYGYLGFRYQKRAAISLEQMKGKVIEFEIYIRILYSSLSDIFTIHRCFKASGYNIGLERICEKIMIPENLIDPNLFSNHEEIYRRAVNIKISIIDFNKDVNIYLRSIRTATSESIVDKLFEELIKLPYKIIYNIGYVVELIKLNENESSYRPSISSIIKDEMRQLRGIMRQLRGIHNTDTIKVGQIITGNNAINKFRFKLIDIGYYLAILGLDLLVILLLPYTCIKKRWSKNSYLPNINGVAFKAYVHNLIARNIVLQHLEILVNHADEIYDQISYKDLIIDISTIFSTHSECNRIGTFNKIGNEDVIIRSSIRRISKFLVEYPHIHCFLERKEYPYKEFLINAIALEIEIKSRSLLS